MALPLAENKYLFYLLLDYGSLRIWGNMLDQPELQNSHVLKFWIYMGSGDEDSFGHFYH